MKLDTKVFDTAKNLSFKLYPLLVILPNVVIIIIFLNQIFIL